MFNGSNCDGKSQLSVTLTEPLNPRDISFLLFKIDYNRSYAI